MRAMALLALAVVGCAAEPSPEVHDDADGETEDAGAASQAAAGRESSFSACMAACSNASFTCTVGGAASADGFVEPGTTGCRGELTKTDGDARALALDCHTRQACVGDDCEDAMFSATSFAWGKTVCTRN